MPLLQIVVLQTHLKKGTLSMVSHHNMHALIHLLNRHIELGLENGRGASCCASLKLPDPRLSRSEQLSRAISSHLPLPPFASGDRQPRPVSGEWRKRSSGSTTSVDGIHSTPQRRASGGSVNASANRSLTASLSEERPPHSHGPFSGHPNVPTHATVSRSSSSSGASGGLDSDAQLSPDAAPLPPPPPSALDLLCEPDDVPILADGWSGVCFFPEFASYFQQVRSSLMK
ncbi:unnamed protein product [Strongylus vulgaris]|uniref:Uncharacterized protein n=1 Tax=Strongylus vulgaris TaxID=40348 RepID=A0A3P7L3A8_STRVU|nr:unnamed protein product [Strongylus vulgaris]